MPSILFHELVADKIAKKYEKYNTNNFYLGAMVPDAVNAYGFASKEKRWHTHLRDADLDKWQNNVMDFYKESYNKYENTYLMGYVVHILTDILCDKIYRNYLYPDLLNKGYDYNSAYSYYEKGIEKLENNNIEAKWWEDAKIKFQSGEKISIKDIDEKMINDWIKYTIDKYSKRGYEETEYITMDFVKKVLDKLENILKMFTN